MILLAALALGLMAGLGLAAWRREAYRPIDLKYLWMVPVALAPQFVAAYLPVGRALPAKSAAALALPLSLAMFLVFAWINRRAPGMALLLIGLVLNLLVISANGGWMPISPATASRLPGGSPPELAVSGIRVGDKDILLRPEETVLEALADRFLLPDWLGYRAAFSAGDTFIAAGAFLMLASPALISKKNGSTDAYL